MVTPPRSLHKSGKKQSCIAGKRRAKLQALAEWTWSRTRKPHDWIVLNQQPNQQPITQPWNDGQEMVPLTIVTFHQPKMQKSLFWL
jgi:hypothetical protein